MTDALRNESGDAGYREPPPSIPKCPNCATVDGVEPCDPQPFDPQARWFHPACALFFTGSQSEWARYATERAAVWARKQATETALREHRSET